MLGVERYSDGGMVAGTLAWGKTCFLQLFFWGSTRNMEPWIECAVNPKNPKRSLHFFSLRHSAVPSFFPLEAESLRKLPPVNLPSWAESRLRLITNATYEPDGHNPTRVVVLYGTGWCAIEMCRDFWWFPTKKGVITKNGRMGISYIVLNICRYDFIVQSMLCKKQVE